MKTLAPRVKPLSARIQQRPRESYGQGRGGRPWRRKVDACKARAEGLCEPHRKLGLIHVGHECDHIIPLSRGGTDDESNLQWVCTTYHREKTNRESHGG